MTSDLVWRYADQSGFKLCSLTTTKPTYYLLESVSVHRHTSQSLKLPTTASTAGTG